MTHQLEIVQSGNGDNKFCQMVLVICCSAFLLRATRRVHFRRLGLGGCRQSLEGQP